MTTTLNLWKHKLGELPESLWQRTELHMLILADNELRHLSPA
ncbi:hypothetical protein [Streptomyces sp. NPDC048603]